MGPRLVSRGDARGAPLPHDPGSASMGPRLVSRGDERDTDAMWVGWKASMGPRLVSRGDLTTPFVFVHAPSLQWGRGL